MSPGGFHAQLGDDRNLIRLSGSSEHRTAGYMIGFPAQPRPERPGANGGERRAQHRSGGEERARKGDHRGCGHRRGSCVGCDHAEPDETDGGEETTMYKAVTYLAWYR